MSDSPMKILIADDEAATRLIVRRRVESWGYEAVLAENGTDAWDQLNSSDAPRIAVLDWMMPGLDGVEICQRLSQDTDRPMTYTILLTSKSEKSDLVTAFENGAHDFLVKPPDADELRCRINVGRRLIEAEDKARDYARQMQELARTDALTGVHNRRAFLELAGKELARIRRFSHTSTLLMLDIDHFKSVNDTHGHDTGDRALQAFAGTVKHCLRETDLFGRIGGEEFGVMLCETEATAAQEAAERIRRAVEEIKVPLEAGALSFTCSIGAQAATADYADYDRLSKDADTALYEAKESGRNRVVLAPAP